VALLVLHALLDRGVAPAPNHHDLVVVADVGGRADDVFEFGPAHVTRTAAQVSDLRGRTRALVCPVRLAHQNTTADPGEPDPQSRVRSSTA
jgi:hypothetical protein